jgi:tRNA(adenine34) deaminase
MKNSENNDNQHQKHLHQNRQHHQHQQDDEHWMREALLLAERARAEQEIPVGAILVRDNTIIGAGYNQPISASDPTAHAEVVALRDGARRLGNYRLLDTTLYVTLEPCPMCVGALIYARIARLVFGTFEPKTGAVGSKVNLLQDYTWNHKIAVCHGVLQQECSAMLSDFFKTRR